LPDWFEEFRMYHRKSGADGSSKVVPLKDDLMSATRYACMSLRHARTHSSDMGKKLTYSTKGIV
jgi:hypothetical protein